MNIQQLLDAAEPVSRYLPTAGVDYINRLVKALRESTAHEEQLAEQVRLLTEQRDAVVAENAHARERHYFIRSLAMSILEHSGGRADWRGAMEDARELLKTVDGVYAQTPATSSAIAALRAEGVEMFAAQERAIAARRKSKGIEDYFIKKLIESAESAEEFARGLRESKGAQS